MFSISRKNPKPDVQAVEPTQEEELTLPMKIAMFSWELIKLKVELFHIHGEMGRRMANEVQVVLAGNAEQIQEYYENIYSDKSIKKARQALDEAKKKIEKTIQGNLRLFQMANFILKNTGKKQVDLGKLQIPEEKIEGILKNVYPENIYHKLNEVREYLDEFLDSVVNICNSLFMQLRKILIIST